MLNRTLLSTYTVFWLSWTGSLFVAWYCEWAELLEILEDSASNAVVGQFPEEAFNRIEPSR
jgi:hypothetical protein